MLSEKVERKEQQQQQQHIISSNLSYKHLHEFQNVLVCGISPFRFNEGSVELAWTAALCKT